MILTRSIRIPSIRTNILKIEDFVLDIQKIINFREEILDRVMISVTEAVNNGIVHGNKSDPEKYVEVTCACYDDRVVITVRDEGTGFRPENIPDPRDEDNLLKEGGRGILIIRAMMDEVEFKTNDSGMEIRMTVKR